MAGGKASGAPVSICIVCVANSNWSPKRSSMNEDLGVEPEKWGSYTNKVAMLVRK